MKSVREMAIWTRSRSIAAGETFSRARPLIRTAPSLRTPWRASAIALGLGSFLFALGACSNSNSDHTFAFVYAPSASLSTGLINAYGAGSQEGNLHLLADSPIPSGGRNPTAIATNPDHKAIYITNHDDSIVVVFTLGTDGKLYPRNTYNTGSFPTALAVSADGKFLYITYTYESGYTTASPGPGGITIFPIVDDATLGAPLPDVPIGRDPVAIATSPTPGFLYVVSQDSAAIPVGATQTSNLFVFSTGPTSGVPTLLAGQTINPGNVPSFGFPSGQSPASALENSPGSFLYVTDNASNTILTYSLSSGVPAEVATVATGQGPRGMAIDPTGKFLFVANYEGTIGEYTLSGGLPTLSTTAPSSAAGAGTTCVAVEPSQGNYVYASGSLNNSITGYQIVPVDGSLKPIIFSPYTASTLPLCLVVVPQSF